MFKEGNLASISVGISISLFYLFERRYPRGQLEGEFTR